MRAFLEVLRFELRLHFTSPLLFGVALLFFAVHLLTLTQTGINLGDNKQIAINSAWLIFQTHLVLGIFGMVPALVFVVTAMTRDAERDTTELFFSTPVPCGAFVLGRFSAGALAAVAVGSIGVAGALAGSFMPWLDSARIQPFDWRPWAASLGLIVLPNLLVFSALFFGVAALARSVALTFGAALGVMVLEVVVNVGAGAAGGSVPRWLVLADPFGALPVAEAARYWTVAELNTQLPTALLGPNRVLWLAVAAGVLLLTLWRYRLELSAPAVALRWRSGRGGRGRRQATVPTVQQHTEQVAAPAPAAIASPRSATAPAALRFDAAAALLQLRSQLRMDWLGVWRSPLFWIVLAMTAWATWSEAEFTLRPQLPGSMPLYPVTSLLLGFARGGLFQFVLLALIYFSAALVFREREAGVDGITDAAPCPDWMPVVSKTLVLCGVVLALLAVTLVVSLAVQEAADFHDHRLDVFLQGVFVYNGFYFLMLCVLAVLVQTLSPGKWSGMVILLVALAAVLAMPAVRLEHLLYGFRIPYVVHSDMNGFGHFRVQTYTLIAYWGAFSVLLLAAGHLLYPRGAVFSLRERLREARMRVSRPLIRTCVAAGLLFAALGAFIFYNTNVLNEYVTAYDVMARQARYELDYGRYRDRPAPSLVDPDLHVELYAAERRLESRGTAGLRNNHTEPIDEFVVSVERRNRVEELAVDGATLVEADPAQGFYLFRPATPLAPGETLTMRWAIVRENRGFPNADPDVEVVANGTYLRGGHVPVPGYCIECELREFRERFGLPPAQRLPPLGSPAHLDDLWPGVNSRSGFKLVFGTDADQTAVAPGVLRRTWEENGRRYFEYSLEGPVWPAVSLQSARYAVALDRWNDVALEVYYDPRHHWNVQTMLETAKTGLEYYSREFGRYALPYYRMAEYARYRRNVQAGVGTIAYSEASGGFAADFRGLGIDLEYATLHELAHQWWGNVYGARMQGRQFLNEGLAQYSTLMVYKEFAAPAVARRIAASFHDGYLAGRGGETVAEQPVIKTEDQAYISYSKAPLALFALEELIGADKVNGALRAYYARFVDPRARLPTSLDLIAELRAAAGPEYQALITNLFEKIVLYDVGITAATARPVDDGYEVVLDVTAKQIEAAGDGAEREVPLDAWFEVAVFPPSELDVFFLEPLYLAHHRLRTGTQRISVRVAEKPGLAGVDPFRLMIDRLRDNNLAAVVIE